MHDWSHIYAISGIVQVELQYLLIYLSSCTRPGDNFFIAQLSKFMIQWCWPRGGHDCGGLITEDPNLNREWFKCDAHEAVAIYGIIALWVCMLPDEIKNSPQVASFLALADVLDLLRLCKEGCVNADTLLNAIITHLIAFKGAYGIIGWIPKHHLAIHLARYLRKFRLLLSKIAAGAHAQDCTQWSRDCYAKQSFERGLIEELTLEHLHALERPWWFDGLQQPLHTPKPNLRRALEAQWPDAAEHVTSASFRNELGCVIHSGDLAFVECGTATSLCEVWWMASVDRHCVACVSIWTRIADDAIGNAVNAATYRKVDSPTFIDCSKLKAAAQFWACGDGVHVVLIPARLA